LHRWLSVEEELDSLLLLPLLDDRDGVDVTRLEVIAIMFWFWRGPKLKFESDV